MSSRKDGPPCYIDGCERARDARGLCRAHYRRLRLYGDPLKLADPAKPKPRYDRDYILGEIEWLREGGMSAYQICGALNFRLDTLERLLLRWGYADLAVFFHQDAA